MRGDVREASAAADHHGWMRLGSRLWQLVGKVGGVRCWMVRGGLVSPEGMAFDDHGRSDSRCGSIVWDPLG